MLLFNAWTAFGVVLMLNLSFLGIAIWMLYKLVRLLINVFQKIFTSLGVSSLQVLLGLGVSILFFSNILTTIISRLGNFLANNFSFISQNLANPVFSEGSASQKSSSILKLSSEWTHEVYGSFQEDILTIPFEMILLFLICWIVISFLLREIFTLESKSSAVTGLRNFFQTAQWRYIVFGVLIFFSIYLSIAAIIAVPVFEDHASPQNISGMDISSELDQFEVDRNGFLSKYTIQPDSSKQLEAAFTLSILDKWNNLVQSTYEQINQNQFEAETSFNITKSQKISAEDKLDYLQSLVTWVVNNKSTLVNNLEKLKPGVMNAVNLLAKTMPSDSTGTLSMDDANVLNQASVTILSKLKLPTKELNPMPREPEIGERFGLFGWIAGWLLKTNLLPLALITGMFGFGLFGATISSIVREDNTKETPKGLLSTDFITLLIRGFSAAMVIFLAVKGGLAVFGSAENSVNPYILFFTCFVAAVFSEDIWAWARKKMNTSLNENT